MRNRFATATCLLFDGKEEGIDCSRTLKGNNGLATSGIESMCVLGGGRGRKEGREGGEREVMIQGKTRGPS